MRQYFEIKDKHPGTILLFRVGDFYETFADDAILVSKELGITLTKRNNGGDMTPLAGFPYHALDTYMPKLIKRGHRVAVCEQTEDPATAKAQKRKIVEREVTEIMTPGVTLSDKLLEHKRNNFLAAVHIDGQTAGVAFSDVSTGELALTQMRRDALPSFLNSILPSELLLSKKLKALAADQFAGYIITFVDDWIFEGEYGYGLLLDHFKTHSLKGFGVEELAVARVAAGALLHYVKENQKASLAQIRRIYAFENTDFMMLDASTKRNLELTASLQEGGSEGTLISILDETRTPMGGRLLRRWIMRPLKRLIEIQHRLDAVEVLHNDHELRSELREQLKQIGDLERLMSKVMVGRANGRDLVQLKRSLEQIPLLKESLEGQTDHMLHIINARLQAIDALQQDIQETLVDEPPASVRDGGLIRDGYHEELEELRDITRNGKEYIARIQKGLIEKTGINSLKLGYNKVFGYYIEVTNSHKEKIPEYFIRKQTLVNAERYITPELKEIEEKILSAEERIVVLEARLFEELCIRITEYADAVYDNAQSIAMLDVLQGLAEISVTRGYCKPEVHEGSELDIKAGRHPVVERFMPIGETFIPNDIYLDNSTEQIMIITGPNMAGKSIILRQTGLIVLLAQIGSFVPATQARIGMVDKIFTRVGASDNLAAGESTFLVEMNEAANILNNATPDSLILLDEVGRGTSTFDGLSIAWSLAEYLHNQPDVAAKTLFATHYHELNELESLYERIVNFNVQVREHNGKVIFLRKLVRGGTDHSYGIQVASMAGLPDTVIRRAREILTNLERHSLDITNKNGTAGADGGADEGADGGADGGVTAGAITGADAGADAILDAQKDTGNVAPNQSAPDKVATARAATRKALREVEKQETLPQLSLFAGTTDPRWETIKNRLEGAEPNRMTPIEALLLLTELKREMNS
ncbi:MAG: DNA mismatch repair protein MutS [Bacteroidetes bacterium]|nr:DNA mismatch repair protein MutS [Bacteroidota bacterium]